MKYYIIPVLAGLTIASLNAQNAGDALRYSTVQNYGTARMAGAGNAFTALGADFGAVSQNPAGLALFRSNEFMFSPAVNYAATKSTLNGTTASDQSTKFRVGNLGLVFYRDPGNNSKWRTANVALGFNQLANYNQSVYASGREKGTILNGWFEEAQDVLGNGGDPESLYPLGAGLAYNAGAIYYLNNQPSYDFVDDPQAETDRTHSVSTTGRTNELSLSFAGNYNGKLLIGASFAAPFINYRQESYYTEKDPGGGYDGNTYYFDQLAYTDYLRTTGIGFNAKVGATFVVNKMLRIGGAVHSPSFYNMTDNFNADFEYQYEDKNASDIIQSYSDNAEASAEPFNYGMRTPWKSMIGVSVLMNKYGFISADAEWVDYTSSRLNLTKNDNSASTRDYEQEVNNAIQRNYKSAINYRMGGELVLDQFRLRAGYNLLGKPSKNADGFNKAWSLGAGVRFDKSYIDVAYRRSDGTGSVSPYTGAPTTALNTDISDVMVTVGFKF